MAIDPPESNNSVTHNKILIIGSSQVKFIRPKSLVNTTVCTCSGAQILDIHDKLLAMDITSYTHIILQVGTNDIYKMSGLIKLEFELLIKTIKLRASPDIEIILSGLPLTCNDKEKNGKIGEVNLVLRLMVLQNPSNVTFACHEQVLSMNGVGLPDLLCDDGYHLNKQGTAKLLRVWHEHVPIMGSTNSDEEMTRNYEVHNTDYDYRESTVSQSRNQLK